MLRLKSVPAQFLFAALFALLLGLRLISPAGFMPSFDHGAVTIVVCPDAGFAPAHHGHDKSKTGQQPCPYAAASAPAALANPAPAIAVLAVLAFAWLVVASPRSLNNRYRLRPPATGPPLLT